MRRRTAPDAPRSKFELRVALGIPLLIREKASVPVKVEVSARHGHLSIEQQAEIREKAEKLLHYFERLTFIEVTVDLQHVDKLVEVVAHSEPKHQFVAHESAPDLIAALTHAIAKVKTQIGHHKQKLQDHRHDPSHAGPEGIHP